MDKIRPDLYKGQMLVGIARYVKRGGSDTNYKGNIPGKFPTSVAPEYGVKQIYFDLYLGELDQSGDIKKAWRLDNKADRCRVNISYDERYKDSLKFDSIKENDVIYDFTLFDTRILPTIKNLDDLIINTRGTFKISGRTKDDILPRPPKVTPLF